MCSFGLYVDDSIEIRALYSAMNHELQECRIDLRFHQMASGITLQYYKCSYCWGHEKQICIDD